MISETARKQHPHAANGARIRRARTLTGLSQQNFAPEVRTTRRHLIKLENGEHLPSAPMRDRIVERTGTDEKIQAYGDEDDEVESFLQAINRRIVLLRARGVVV